MARKTIDLSRHVVASLRSRQSRSRAAPRRRRNPRRRDPRHHHALELNMSSKTESFVRLLGLRPHARAARRARRSRRRQPDLSAARSGRDVLPHGALPRVRCLRDVALVVLRLEVQRRSVHRDPGMAVALFPPFVHLRQHEQRHQRTEGPDRQAQSARPNIR